jgi:hypothetical protein
MSGLQGLNSAIPAVVGVGGAIWIAIIRRTAKARFEQSVSREFSAVYEKNRIAIELQRSEMQIIEREEEALIRRMNEKAERYSTQLEKRIDGYVEDIEALGKKLRIIEIENRNTVRENISHMRYSSMLAERLRALGEEPPERPREFREFDV